MAPPRATARQQPSPLSVADPGPATDPATIALHKQAAAQAAAELVTDGMAVGLGTGSTVAHLLSVLGERAGELRRARCVATSPATARIARDLGLHVVELDDMGGELDLAIDGADQVDPRCWLVKGGGGAHTREKIVAAAARRFVVIVSAEKQVASLHPPVPLEVLRFGAAHTLAAVGNARLRGDLENPDGNLQSPDGNLIADYFGSVGDPASLAARLSATPGVVEPGLFPPELVSEVLIAGADGVRRRAGGRAPDTLAGA
jgi:ribose 5-phosphate isomerase A